MIKSSQVSCKINPNTQYMYLLPPHPNPHFLPHFIIVIFNHNLLAINLWPPVDPTPTQPQKSFSSDVKVITESQTRDPWTGSLSQTILYSLYILHSLCIEYSLSRFFSFYRISFSRSSDATTMCMNPTYAPIPAYAYPIWPPILLPVGSYDILLGHCRLDCMFVQYLIWYVIGIDDVTMTQW